MVDADLTDVRQLLIDWATASGQAVWKDPWLPADVLAWGHFCSEAETKNRCGLFINVLADEWRDQHGRSAREKLRPADRQWADAQLSAFKFTAQDAAALQRELCRAAQASPHVRKRIIGAAPLPAILGNALSDTAGPPLTREQHQARLRAEFPDQFQNEARR